MDAEKATVRAARIRGIDRQIPGAVGDREKSHTATMTALGSLPTSVITTRQLMRE